MPIRNYTNTAAPTSLTSGVGQDDTTLPVASTTGYPSAPFTITIDRGGVNEEAVLVQGKTANSFTDCQRGFNGTTKHSHLSTVSVEHTTLALDYADANAHIYNTSRDDHTQYLTEDRLLDLLAAGVEAPSLSLPVGSIIPYGGTVSPDTAIWLLAYGQAVSRTTYAALFALYGTTFGPGDGLSTFNLPNLRGRVIVGLDNMGGASANVIVAAQADQLGGLWGSETVTLTTAQLPSHAHVITHTHGAGSTNAAGDHSHNYTIQGQFLGNSGAEAGGWGLQNAGGFTNRPIVMGSGGSAMSTAGSHSHSVTVPQFSGNSGNTGGGDPHPNVQPSMALGYLVRAAA